MLHSCFPCTEVACVLKNTNVCACLQCHAFTWDGRCGYLKAAGGPRVRSAGMTSVVLTAAGDLNIITAAQGQGTQDDDTPDYANTSAGGAAQMNSSSNSSNRSSSSSNRTSSSNSTGRPLP